MTLKSSFFFTICIILGLCLAIIIPVCVITSNLQYYGTINDKRSFYYSLSKSSMFKHLNLECDIGNVEINYRYPPGGDLVRIETNIEMSGFNLANKSYSDFFLISFQSNNTALDFKFKVKPNLSRLILLSLIKNITISVTIRADAEININTDVENGNVKLLVPFGIDIENVLIKVNEGNISQEYHHCYIGGNITACVNNGTISIDLSECIIQGDISGSIKDGNMEFFSSNVTFTRNSSFFFNITHGDLNVYLYQSRELGANITGRALIDNGMLLFDYEDNTANLGAKFEIPYGAHTSYELPPCFTSIYEDCPINGFEYNQFNYDLIHNTEGSLVFISNDLLEKRVKNYYDVIFELIKGSFSTRLNSLD